MKTLAVLLALAAPAVARDDKETLAQALGKAAAFDSYAFKGETEFLSQFGGAGPAQIPSMDGKYQKDSGLHIKSNRGEIFRKGDRILVKQAQGDWQDLKQVQPPAPAEGEKPNRNRNRVGAFKMMVLNFKAPHEELKDLARSFKEVKKAEQPEKVGEIECALYSSDLTDDAMKGSPLGRLLGQFGGANADVKGSARVWVDGAGNVVIYELVTKAVLEIQGNQIELSMIRRSEISEAGKVKVEVPEAVQKLLAAPVKSEDKKEDK